MSPAPTWALSDVQVTEREEGIVRSLVLSRYGEDHDLLQMLGLEDYQPMTPWRLRKQSRTDDKSLIKHGTRSGYSNYGCKCDPCREAERDYRRSYTRQYTGTGPVPEGVRHGTRYAYKRYGCRCEECKAADVQANRAWHEERMRRKGRARV